LIGFDWIVVKSDEQEIVNLSFEVDGTLALVGESGSGKSLTLKAIMGILPKELDVDIKIKDGLTLKRGVDISFVPQNPFTALSPMSKIKKQGWGIKKEVLAALFEKVGLDAVFFERFPSELSGGQLQRVVIALSLASSPRLLLMDEPTTALDKDTKDEILELIKNLQKELGFDLIFVTHELTLASYLCEDILLIRDGKALCEGKSADFFKSGDEYIQKLIKADFKNRDFRR
jgi:peptide/nickel transport system ATP-binding protein